MGQKKTGKLPPEEIIVLESGPELWRLFEKRLISELSTAGVIAVEDKKIRVEIEVQMVIPPEHNFLTTNVSVLLDTFDTSKAKGVSRAEKFFFEKIGAVRWVLFGCLKGTNRIPVVIVHYERFGISIYAQKLLGEGGSFLPNGISLN